MPKKFTHHPDQFDLFARAAGINLVDIPNQPTETAGGLDCKRDTRDILGRYIKRSGLSRDAIAARLSGLTGEQIAKSQIDMWTKASHPSNLPAHFLPALTQILGVEFLNEFALKAGCRVAGQEELLLAQIGQAEVINMECERRKRSAVDRLPRNNKSQEVAQ